MVGLAGAEVEKCEIEAINRRKLIPNSMANVSVIRSDFEWATSGML